MTSQKNDGISEYARIQMTLARQVEEGILKPLERLPADKDLAAAYGVSVGTIIKAIGNLVNAGYLSRAQGKGTFVNEILLAPASRRFFRLRPDFESPDINFSMKLLTLEQRADLNAIHPALPCFAAHTPGYFMLRQMYDQEKTVAFSLMLISGIVCPNLDRISRYDHEHRSLNWILREKYNLESRRREEFTRVGLPGEKVLDAFDLGPLSPQTPFLLVEARDYLGAAEPFFYHLMITADQHIGLFREL